MQITVLDYRFYPIYISDRIKREKLYATMRNDHLERANPAGVANLAGQARGVQLVSS